MAVVVVVEGGEEGGLFNDSGGRIRGWLAVGGGGRSDGRRLQSALISMIMICH